MLLVKMKSLGVLNDVKAKGRFSSSEYTIFFLLFKLRFGLHVQRFVRNKAH